jgi:hypothetical protein
VAQALPSLQLEPSALLGFEQAPVAGSQTPATWHWSIALQTVVVPPVQTPPWQVSPDVQALPSLHAVPLAIFASPQTPLEQEATLQGFEGVGHVAAVQHWPSARHTPLQQLLMPQQTWPQPP